MPTLTITLPSYVMASLENAAATQGRTPEELAVTIIAACLDEPDAVGCPGGGMLGWDAGLEVLVERFRAGVRTSGISAEELETEVAAAVHEVRQERVDAG
jgi:hypothetical protein